MTNLAHADLDKHTVTKAYDALGTGYDLVFGAVFERGREAAIAAAERVGGRILEVGVGTGISLPHYSRECRLCGIDISEQMLRKAQDRVTEFGLSNVEGLWVMDAEHLSFPDDVFRRGRRAIRRYDCAESRGDPRRVRPRLETRRRDHSGQPRRRRGGVRRTLEHLFQPAARKLGWRTEFSFQRYARWAERTNGVSLVERRAMPPLGHFSLIRFAKAGGADNVRPSPSIESSAAA